VSEARCDRVELERWVDPTDLDAEATAHVAGCADCTARLAGYRRMVDAMRDVGTRRVRARDHRARLHAAIDRDAGVRRRRVAMIAAGAVAIAAAVVIAIWLSRDTAAAPRLQIAIVRGDGAIVRGDAGLGDRLRVVARDGAQIAIRVYRNDRELVLDCPRACRRDGGAQTGELVLDAVARYQIVWLDGPAPPPTGALDPDIEAAVAAGARHELREIDVR
jgi:hypothetical protein